MASPKLNCGREIWHLLRERSCLLCKHRRDLAQLVVGYPYRPSLSTTRSASFPVSMVPSLSSSNEDRRFPRTVLIASGRDRLSGRRDRRRYSPGRHVVDHYDGLNAATLVASGCRPCGCHCRTTYEMGLSGIDPVAIVAFCLVTPTPMSLPLERDRRDYVNARAANAGPRSGARIRLLERGDLPLILIGRQRMRTGSTVRGSTCTHRQNQDSWCSCLAVRQLRWSATSRNRAG